MEKNEIQYRLKSVSTLADFAKLLNDVKTDEFRTSKHKITEKQLLHFCNPKTVPNRYKTFHIRKKSGGLREINAPCFFESILYLRKNMDFLWKKCYDCYRKCFSLRAVKKEIGVTI